MNTCFEVSVGDHNGGSVAAQGNGRGGLREDVSAWEAGWLAAWEDC